MSHNNSKYLIFIIDDETTLADSLAMVFEVKGFRVKIFETVEEALNRFREGLIPKGIIIDGHLPGGMAGPEGIRAFRLAGYIGDFVGISADDFEGEMLRAGAKSFWSKPIEMLGFVDSVDQILGEDLVLKSRI